MRQPDAPTLEVQHPLGRKDTLQLCVAIVSITASTGAHSPRVSITVWETMSPAKQDQVGSAGILHEHLRKISVPVQYMGVRRDQDIQVNSQDGL
jgi:hypothetical protein